MRIGRLVINMWVAKKPNKIDDLIDSLSETDKDVERVYDDIDLLANRVLVVEEAMQTMTKVLDAMTKRK